MIHGGKIGSATVVILIYMLLESIDPQLLLKEQSDIFVWK